MSFASAFSRGLVSSRSMRMTRMAARPQRLSPFVRTIVTKRYTKDHEAVIFDDETKIGTITITDYAQESLGDVVFVELPTVGTAISQGETIGAVESVKAASDIYAPVSGIIEEVNEELGNQPSLINKSPEDDAWLCKIKLINPKEVDSLLNETQYKEFCESN